jgi:hypothetical protein
MGRGVPVFVAVALLISAHATTSGVSAQDGARPRLAQAEGALARRDYPAAIAALEQALREVRQAAPLAVESFALVGEPAKSYGAYAARPNAEFRGKEEMHFYLEPKNLVSSRSAAGLYEPGFDVDFEIVDEDGDTVAKQERFGSFRFTSKSALQDIYVNLHVSVEGAPPGAYEIRFTLRDANSPKTATVKQAFRML